MLAAGLAVLIVGAALAATTLASAGTARQTRANAGLTVLAASSLTNVFPQIAPGNNYSFAGSDVLAAQIQHGAPADVYAAASPKYPQQLYQQGLVLKPVVFASNRLVVITPTSNPAGITNVLGLCKPGVKVVIGDKAVPIGSYTRQIITNMGLQCVLSHVVSNEQNVRDILTKVSLGEADAGFVYITDAKTVPGKVNTIALPGWAQPHVKYEMAIVASSNKKADGAAFIAQVLSKRGQKIMASAGFGAPKGTVTK